MCIPFKIVSGRLETKIKMDIKMQDDVTEDNDPRSCHSIFFMVFCFSRFFDNFHVSCFNEVFVWATTKMSKPSELSIFDGILDRFFCQFHSLAVLVQPLMLR